MVITNKSIDGFLETVESSRIDDIKWLIEMGKRITKREPQMWGTIIGFGKAHYKYDSGTEGDMPIFGLSNRKNALTLYLSLNINQYELLSKLGNYKTGKSCLYIKNLKDVDLNILEDLSESAYNDTLKLPFITITG